MVMVEGIATQLNPKINMWDVSAPFVRSWIRDELGPEAAIAERLREDFERAQMGPRVGQNWDRFLSGGDRGGFISDGGIGEGPRDARKRVSDALDDLGPGLSDVVMRVCCFLEGMEQAEKRLGWSARSGKVVLKIGLQRLLQHYEQNYGFRPALRG